MNTCAATFVTVCEIQKGSSINTRARCMIAALINRVVAPLLSCSRDESSGILKCRAQWGGLGKTALIGGSYL